MIRSNHILWLIWTVFFCKFIVLFQETESTRFTMGDVGGNSAQAEIEEVRGSVISAPIELNRTIHFNILFFVISLCYSRKLNVWDRRALGVWRLEQQGPMSTVLESVVVMFIFKGQILCAKNGCNAKVHRWCQFAWFKKARLPVDYSSPVYCPAHNIQHGDYIRWNFASRK